MSKTLAHVSYVIPKEEQAAFLGTDPAFLAQPITDPAALVVLLGSVLVSLLTILLLPRLAYVQEKLKFFRGRVRSYQELVPWMLRLSLGILLIGAGSAQQFFTPAAVASPLVAGVEITLGFCLLLGLALTPTLLITLALYLGSLFVAPQLIGSLEILAATISLLILGSSRPGVDDLLGVSMYTFKESVKMYVPFLLRLGLGVPLITLAVGEKFMNPHLTAEVVTRFHLVELIPLSPNLWVLGMAIVELLLGVALLFGFQTRAVSILTFLVLTLSFFFFGEQVHAHVTIFGTLSALIVLGAGPLSLDNAFYAKRRQLAA